MTCFQEEGELHKVTTVMAIAEGGAYQCAGLRLSREGGRFSQSSILSDVIESLR